MLICCRLRHARAGKPSGDAASGTDVSLLTGTKRSAFKHLLPRASGGFWPDLLAAMQIRPLIRHPKYKTEASIAPCWALHYWPVHSLQNDHAALWLPCSSAGLLHVARPASTATGGLAVWGSSRCTML